MGSVKGTEKRRNRIREVREILSRVRQSSDLNSVAEIKE